MLKLIDGQYYDLILKDGSTCRRLYYINQYLMFNMPLYVNDIVYAKRWNSYKSDDDLKKDYLLEQRKEKLNRILD